MTNEEMSESALASVKAGKFDDALKIAEEMIAGAPATGDSVADAWLIKGFVHENLGEFPQAIQAFTEVTQKNPESSLAWYRLSNTFTAIGDFAQALPAIRKAIELKPELARDVDALSLLTWSLNETGQAQEALDTLEESRKTAAELFEDGRLDFQEGFALNSLGNPAKALELLTKAAASAKEPGIVGTANIQRGLAHQSLQQQQEAVECFRSALKSLTAEPVRAWVWIHLSRSYVALNDKAKADEALDNAAKLAATSIVDPSMLARVELQLGLGRQSLTEHVEALKHFEKTLALMPPQPARGLVWLRKAASCLALNDRPQANDALTHAAQEQTPSIEFFIGKGTLLTILGRYEEALADYEEVLQIDPSSRDAWDQKAGLLTRLQRFPEALQSVEKALEFTQEGPPRAGLRIGKAFILSRQGNLAEALVELDKASADDPNAVRNSTFLDLKVQVLLGLGRVEEVGQFFKTLSQDPSISADLTFQNLWANALLLVGKPNEAFARFEAIAEHEPADTNASNWRIYGYALAALRRFEEASSALAQARTLEPTIEADPQYLVSQAIVNAGMERYEEALNYANTLAARGLGGSASYLIGGASLFALGRYDEALEEFNRVLADSRNTMQKFYEGVALIQKGRVLMTLRRRQQALLAFTEAAELQETANTPYRVIALVGQGLLRFQLSAELGEVEMRQSRDDALRMATIAADLSENFDNDQIKAFAWWSKGNILCWSERDEEALISYQRAAAYQPNLAYVHLSVAKAHDLLQDHEQSLKCFTAAIDAAEVTVEKAEAWIGKGKAQYHLEQYEDALNAYRQAIVVAGENEKVLELLGATYSALRRHGAAQATFRRGWNLGKPAKRSATCALGVSAALLEQKRNAEARTFLEQAEKQTKFTGELFFNYGVTLYRLKQFGLAAKALRKASSLQIPGADDYAQELEEGGGGPVPTWLTFWFGNAPLVRKAIGLVFLMLLLFALLPALVKPSALAFLPWLDMNKDWKVMLIPIVVLTTFLLLPILKRVSAGNVEFDISQAEAKAGRRPDLEHELRQFGATTGSVERPDVERVINEILQKFLGVVDVGASGFTGISKQFDSLSSGEPTRAEKIPGIPGSELPKATTSGEIP